MPASSYSMTTSPVAEKQTAYGTAKKTEMNNK